MELFAFLTAAAASAASTAPTWLPIAGTAVSGGLAYGAAKQQAEQQKMAGELNAREMERAASEARGDAARKADARRDKEEAVLSQLRARAASSGGGASGTEGYSDAFGDIAQAGQHRFLSELAIGENNALGYESKAAVSRWEGDTKAAQSKAKGTAALVNAGFDIAGSALKRRPMASGSTDDFVFDEYGAQTNGGWSTRAKRTSKLRYG